jgi:hypothetical protein
MRHETEKIEGTQRRPVDLTKSGCVPPLTVEEMLNNDNYSMDGFSQGGAKGRVQVSLAKNGDENLLKGLSREEQVPLGFAPEG